MPLPGFQEDVKELVQEDYVLCIETTDRDVFSQAEILFEGNNVSIETRSLNRLCPLTFREICRQQN